VVIAYRLPVIPGSLQEEAYVSNGTHPGSYVLVSRGWKQHLAFPAYNKRRRGQETSHTFVMVSLPFAKLPWTLYTVFSFIYFCLFILVSHGKLGSDHNFGLMGGFCVWGTPPEYPNDTTGCTTPANSHMYAWYEDAIMTLFVVAAYFMSNKSKK
jgi:hypothetical protein